MSTSPEWLVESLRLTGFLEEPLADPARIDWWSEVVGDQPANTASRPREGMFQWAGDFDLGSASPTTLGLEVEPLRTDWNLTGSPQPEDPLAFVTIGSLTETLPTFLERLTAWIGNFPSCPRFALGGAVLLPSVSVEAAYEQLSGLLPALDIDPAESRDLLYRINRPRSARSLPIDHPGINRITTWSVVTINSMFLSIPGTFVGHQQGPSAARLEFDINTIPNQPNLIPGDRLIEVADELQRACNGDRAERGRTMTTAFHTSAAGALQPDSVFTLRPQGRGGIQDSHHLVLVAYCYGAAHHLQVPYITASMPLTLPGGEGAPTLVTGSAPRILRAYFDPLTKPEGGLGHGASDQLIDSDNSLVEGRLAELLHEAKERAL